MIWLANNPSPSVCESEDAVHAGCILYKESIQKITKVCTDAREDGIPVIWLQDVAGFDIGEDAENKGLLRYGAALLRELADDALDNPPHLCVLLRKASGAGYYAMKGAPFSPAWIVATAATRLEVMAPQTLADTMYRKKIQSLGDSPENAAQRQMIETARLHLIEHQTESSRPQSAAMRGDVDMIVYLHQLRQLAVSFVRAAYQSTNHIHKPSRLWASGQVDL